jgi:hypothetical protein
MDGVDDLGVVDALQVHRRDAEIAVAPSWRWITTHGTPSRELDGMGMPRRLRGETTPDAYQRGRVQACTGRGARPVPAACRTVGDTRQGPNGQLEPPLEPRLQLLPAPPQSSADRPDSAGPWCEAVSRREGRASLRAIDVDQRSSGSSGMTPPRARNTKPRIPRRQHGDASRQRHHVPRSLSSRDSWMRRSVAPASCDSDGARAQSDQELAPAGVVPMHRMQGVRRSGASVSRPTQERRRFREGARFCANATARHGIVPAARRAALIRPTQ